MTASSASRVFKVQVPVQVHEPVPRKGQAPQLWVTLVGRVRLAGKRQETTGSGAYFGRG